MLVTKNQVTSFIPHRTPMVLIHGLGKIQDDKIYAHFKVEESCPFVVNGFLNEGGLVETMAQAVALAEGYRAKDEQPRLGFIGGIKKLQVHAFPEQGSDLQVVASLKSEVMNIKVVQGEVFCADKLMASCEIKLVLEN